MKSNCLDFFSNCLYIEITKVVISTDAAYTICVFGIIFSERCCSEEDICKSCHLCACLGICDKYTLICLPKFKNAPVGLDIYLNQLHQTNLKVANLHTMKKHANTIF